MRTTIVLALLALTGCVTTRGVKAEPPPDTTSQTADTKVQTEGELQGQPTTPPEPTAKPKPEASDVSKPAVTPPAPK